MIVSLLILLCLFQGDASPAKWDCAKNFEPPDKNVIRLKAREINERVVSCETLRLRNGIDAKGAVLVEVLVNEIGEVVCVRAMSGHPIIRTAALEAAKKWKFKPLVVDGQPKYYSGFVYVYVSWDVDEMKKRCPKQ